MRAPQGTKRLLTAQLILGMGSYLVLIGAGRSMNPGEFAAFSVFWSLVFSFGLGLFGPVELLVLRLSALPRSKATSIEIRRLRRWYRWAGLVAGASASLFLIRTVGEASNRPLVLAASAFAYFQVLRVLAIQRGIAAGRNDLPRYARQVGADGLVRGALAALLVVLMVGAPWVWAWAVVLAGIAGAAAARSGAVSTPGQIAQDASAARGRETLRDVLVLTAGTSLSVVLSNSLPSMAALLGAGAEELAGFSAAVIISRIPVFFAGVGQALIVPVVTSAADDAVRLKRVSAGVLGAVAAVSAAIVVVVALVIDPIMAMAFPSTTSPDLSVTSKLALSTGALMFALLGQGILIGQGRMTAVAGIWLTAAATGAATMLLAPGGVIERVAAASAVSSLAACVALLAVVLLLPTRVTQRSPSSARPDRASGDPSSGP